MAPIDWSWGEAYASPTIFAPAQHPTADFTHPALACSSHWQSHDYTSASMQPQQSHHHKTSRKRSRDEMAAGYDDDDSDSSRASTTPFPSARPTPSPPKLVHQPDSHLLAPGEILAQPLADGDDLLMVGAQLDAASQPGTWAEELSERLRSSSMREYQQIQQPRPALESRKSMRLDRELGDVTTGNDASPSTSTPMSVSAAPTPNAGYIDEASLTLGIGWSSIPSNSTMDAASRGWARHIESHFALQNVRIVWMNKSLPAYLVSAVTCDDGHEFRGGSPQAASGSGSRSHSPFRSHGGSPGYYLFDENLSQGRLVAKSWERALENLRSAPLAFDGDAVMQSTETANAAKPTPKPIRAQYWAGWGFGTARILRSPSPPPAPALPPVTLVAPAGAGADSMDVDL